MNNYDKDQIHDLVKKHYKDFAVVPSCCGSKNTTSTCCSEKDIDQYSQALGYSSDDLAGLPDNANLGLGCGNPTSFSDIQPGETVLDLGSGGGLDAFIAARLVGDEGKVIGVDMTSEMIALARENASKGHYPQVEFREGFIENLPVEDNSVDLVISNCVVNLSPDKGKVYREVFRVLKPGGRIAISDPVRFGEIPAALLAADDSYCECISGAASIAELEKYLISAGFENISITPVTPSKEVINSWIKSAKESPAPADVVASMLITANKPD